MASSEPPTLFSLPTEIVELVLDHVAPEDIPAVRQCCKTLEGLSRVPFGSKCLANLGIVMTGPALEGCISLLQHEVFGLSVQKLMFSTARVEERITTLMSAVRDRRPDKKRTLETIASYGDAAATQQRFLGSGTATTLLTKIFTILKSRNQEIEFGISDSAYGYGYTASSFSALDLEVWSSRPGCTLQMLVQATMTAHYRPNRLSVELQDWNQGSTSDNERFARLVERLAAAGARGRISGGMELKIAVGGQEVVLDSKKHGIAFHSSHGTITKQLVQGYTLQFLAMHLFHPGTLALILSNIKISWEDIKIMVALRGDDIAELEIRGVDIICTEAEQEGEEIWLLELVKGYTPWERVVLEDISCSRVAEADEEEGKDADANAESVTGIITTESVTEASSQLTMLVNGKHEWTSRAAVLRGLDTLIEQREQAKRNEQERAEMELQLSLSALAMVEKEIGTAQLF